MSRLVRTLAALCLMTFAGLACASFHTWEIAQIYSNADGTIQFVQLRETRSDEELLCEILGGRVEFYDVLIGRHMGRLCCAANSIFTSDNSERSGVLIAMAQVAPLVSKQCLLYDSPR